MTQSGKVVWGEGMFLTPHLFQQADRYHEQGLDFRVRAVVPFGWGFIELELDDEAVTNGEIAIRRCAGVLPDGLVFQVPQPDRGPSSRSIKSHFSVSTDRVSVYLAVPVVREGTNVRLDGAGGGPPTRYETEMTRVPDETADDNEGEIPFARKSFRLLFSGEALDDTVSMKLAEVTRTESGAFRLSDAFVPASLSVRSSPRLLAMLREVLDLLTARSTSLAAQRRHLADFAQSDIATFWLLHTVNSTIPLLAHLASAPEHHPERVYVAFAQLVGQLSAFALDSDPRDVPAYDHDRLGEVFAELVRRIRTLLDTVIPIRYVIIPLVRTRELLHVGRVEDERLLKTAQFYLGADAKMPAGRLVEELPAKSKISSPDHVGELIGRAVPGVELLHEPVPPAAIPVRAGFKYFQLSRHGRAWEAINRAKALALYLPDDFPELKLELIAVKS
jgi:type VI secretion system protein ImpJ